MPSRKTTRFRIKEIMHFVILFGECGGSWNIFSWSYLISYDPNRNSAEEDVWTEKRRVAECVECEYEYE